MLRFLVSLFLLVSFGLLLSSNALRKRLAEGLWLETAAAWEHKNWYEMKWLCEAVTLLQPHSEVYVTMAAWHMAWNAAEDEGSKELTNPSYQNRRAYYIRCGLNFLEKGIKNNPKSSLLYTHLGFLFRDRLQDHSAAAAAFAQAATLPNALPYVHRFAFYEMAECPGHEQEAYVQLMALYHKGREDHVPALLAKIDLLEKKLKIPNCNAISIR